VPSPRTNGLRDARAWLREQGYGHVAGDIDGVMGAWARAGKRTRRNWWDVLAGDRFGRPRRVGGVAFPVLVEAQRRQGRRVAPQPAGRPAEVARPFLKWAGGKRQLLSKILPLLPQKLGTYHEPFVGGGAVFFGLRPPRAVLSDGNRRLIRAFQGIKDDVERVIALLRGYPNEKSFYLDMRKRPIDDASDAEVAAWMIFVNKVGFNGLYRVNSKNQLNVPFGDNAWKRVSEEPNLRACAAALKDAKLHCEDFTRVLDRARRGDVVYFDPPYLPMSGTAYFTSYTSGGFRLEDHRRLREVALELHRRGVFVLLSNSSAAAVRELYGPPFEILEVAANRSVNSKVSRRGPITELLIRIP
jgi:DNA adenine methylase